MPRKSKQPRTEPGMKDLWGGAASPTGEHPRAAWFRAAKYAMFIHWGLYAQAANVWRGRNWHGIAEWLMCRAKIPVREYETLARSFNPQGFDAEEWALLAKRAGMRYLVLTAKHHEGFAMFKSKASAYNIVDATPFQRDPIAELAKACRKHGLGLGFYYSQFLDWHEKDAAGNDWEFGPADAPGRNFEHYLQTKALPQITELLTNYGEVALIWFDTPGSISRAACESLQALIRRLQPDCLINSRIGNGLGDYSSLGDQEIPVNPPQGLWETVDTHNDTWAYSRHDHHWKGPRELIGRLCRVASLGGTYMLNVGPTGEGRIPEASAEILGRVGAWLGRNGEALYGTARSPIAPQAWGVVTAKPGQLFLHLLEWPRSGRIVVPGIKTDRVRATVLATGAALSAEVTDAGIVIHLPLVAPELPATVIALELGGELQVLDRGRFFHPGLPNLFPAPFAEVAGCVQGRRQWMEKFGDWHHAEVIEGFATGSSACWNFTALGGELCNVFLQYDCLPEADGSELELSLGDTRWAFPVQCTGSGHGNRARFRRESLGVVAIPGPGRCALKLTGIEIKGTNALRLQTVCLEPVG